jgi:L-iditol 2-dehydrogenase
VKAVRFHGVDDLRVDDIPIPVPGPREVLLRMTAVGVCGTDTHILDGHYPAKPPVTLGHEVSAVVEALGPEVAGLAEGDAVTVEPHKYCGKCTYCRRGMEHMCLTKQAYGVHLDGGMAEFAVVPARVAYRLPPGIEPAIGALTEPLACCVHSMDRLEPRSGLPILVSGCGPAGAMLVALAAASGLSAIVVADTRRDRRDLAIRMGADAVLDPTADGFREQALALTAGEGFPYLVDAVGHPAILETSIALAGRGARILVFGVAAPDATAVIRPNEIYTKELTILGSAVNPYTHHRAVGLLHKLPLHEIKVKTFPLSRAADALQAVRDGRYDKVQLVPNTAPVPDSADVPA